MVYALAFLGALLVGAGSVVEQRNAAQAPPEYNLSPRLLLWLVRRPAWLAGWATTLLGNLAFAGALGIGGTVALVQAVFTTRLLFALGVSSAWSRHRVPLRDWVGAFAIIAGLVGFLVGSRPGPGDGARVPDVVWVAGVGSVALLVVTAVVVARAAGPVLKAVSLGLGAGALYGLQSSLIHIAGDVADGGIAALLSNWSGYTVVAMAVLGMLLVQSAYEAAPLTVSYPAIVATELLAGISLGVLLLGGTVSLHPVGIVFGAVGIAAMVVGITLLTTSPLVTGQLDRLVAQQEVGLIRQLESRLERELRRADRDLSRTEARLAAGSATRPARRLRRELDGIEQGIDRLLALQRDIGTHRSREWERGEQESGLGPAELAEQDRQLREHERVIDERARQLRDRADRLEPRRDRVP